MLFGIPTSPYACLKNVSLSSVETSSPARRTSSEFLLVTRKPLSQGGRGGGAVSSTVRSRGIPMLCVVMVFGEVGEVVSWL